MIQYYDPGTYKAKNSIGYLVRRAGNLMTARVEAAFAEHEITFAQWLVLMNLRDGLATTAAEIARDMCHDSGALTRVIDQLDQRGFIARCRSLTDRRAVELTLTEAGLRTVNSLVPLVTELLNTAVAGFTRDEVDTLTRLLTKLVAAGSELPEPCAKQLELLE
jgi:DNA-binding MarR family transcriptional regulator